MGDRRQVGTVVGNLGYAARSHLLESLDIARALNDHYRVVYQTFNLGLAEYLSGSLSAAEDLFAESFDLARHMGMEASTAYALIGMAILALTRPGWPGPPGSTVQPTRPWRFWARLSSL